MIIEQAFFNLPEVLVGTGYQKQDYEAGIVSAMSLAILQALNGRNLDNPISAIRVEKRYPFDNTKNRKKYLRYDLDLDIGNLGILNSRMKKYGWRRHSNLECKFFRTAGNKKPANTTTNSILCLLDVIRLCTLQTSKDSTRYFLHVYDRNPNEYRVADLTDMDNLFRAGRRIIEIDCSALATRQTSNKKSVEQYKKAFNPIKNIKLVVKLENTIIKPLLKNDATSYWAILNRILSCTITYEANSSQQIILELRSNGFYNNLDDAFEIREYVYDNINAKASENVPDKDEMTGDGDKAQELHQAGDDDIFEEDEEELMESPNSVKTTSSTNPDNAV